MIEIMYDISSGSNYKFNTAFIGEQVRPSVRGSMSLALCWLKLKHAWESRKTVMTWT